MVAVPTFLRDPFADMHTLTASGSKFRLPKKHSSKLELELELIQTQMAQKPMLRAEVGMRVRCANKASAE